MGAAMAKPLVSPLVYDLERESTRPVGNVAASIAEVGERCGVISVAVFDDSQVRDVVGELRGSARDGAVIAIHSTIAPGTAEELAARTETVHIVDAPVTGGPMGAAEAALVAMVGGSDEAVARCREAFTWASRGAHAGPVGAGTRMKLVRNLIPYASFAAAGEAQRRSAAPG